MGINNLQNNGFEIIENIYTSKEIEGIIAALNQQELEQSFGVRAILRIVPSLRKFIFNEALFTQIKSISPKAKLIKSIYFDKPPSANWLVNWHQDLTINVLGKTNDKGFKNWRIKKERTVVQPPPEILENIFTIRIHLDDCTKENGALRVVPKSNREGIVRLNRRVEELNKRAEVCKVKRGGILIMKPLLFHASKRTENEKRRRVIHLEFSDMELPKGLEWKELEQLAGAVK